MWTLQVFVPGLSHPLNMAFKEEAGARVVVNAIESSVKEGKDVNVADDYGCEFRLASVYSPILRLEHSEKFLDAQNEYQLANAKAQARFQKMMQGDPALKFLQGTGAGRFAS